MTDAELGKLVNGAIDDAGFGATLLERVREAVTGAIAAVAPVVPQGEDAERDARPGAVKRTTAGESERRANAFRAMAGVRV